jgi:cell wall-associated NlpC family hydrolase
MAPVVPTLVKPGDFGLVPVAGDVGKTIRVLQWMDGTGFSNYEHAFVYVGGGMIVEAETTGAAYRPFHYGDEVLWSSGIIVPTAIQRANIEHAAIRYQGTPYSYLDYASLVAKRLHAPGHVLEDYIKSTGHMICSQLVAACYRDAGCPLYDTWTGNVTPGDLYDLLLVAKSQKCGNG